MSVSMKKTSATCDVEEMTRLALRRWRIGADEQSAGGLFVLLLHLTVTPFIFLL